MADGKARRCISDFDIKIYGTDIDPNCIEKAKIGLYGPTSVKEVKEEVFDKYLHKEGENYRISESVKHLTRFEAHNLVSDEFLAHLDLILCRNVVIYFTRPLQEMIYSGFVRALNKGGFLALGKVESLWGYAKDYFEVFDTSTPAQYQPRACRRVDNGERIYRKT